MAFQEFIASISSKFAICTGSEIGIHILTCLEGIGRFVGVEASFVILLSDDGKSYSHGYEWHQEGFPDVLEFYKSVPFDIESWTGRIILGGEVIRINSLDDIPLNEPDEREFRMMNGVRSALIVPLRGRGGLVKGGIGIRIFSKEKHWSALDEQRLKLLGDIIANVLERIRAEESLKTSLDQLHTLTAQFENIREEERKSISHEVHDELGQLLTAIRMDFMTIIESGFTDKNTFRARMRSVVKLTDKAIEAVQQISSRLRPEILDYLGLLPAIEWQVDEFKKHSNLKCILHAPKYEPDIDSALSTVLFRILQEALTNVARHADAGNVEVSFMESDAEYVLTVADDGIGISDSQINSPNSFGLLGIKERLHPYGGVCSISHRSAGGTEINVRLPKPIRSKVAK